MPILDDNGTVVCAAIRKPYAGLKKLFEYVVVVPPVLVNEPFSVIYPNA